MFIVVPKIQAAGRAHGEPTSPVPSAAVKPMSVGKDLAMHCPPPGAAPAR